MLTAVFARGKHKRPEFNRNWYDYNQALEASKELKKPVLIDFTGWNCANCRKMEADVWSNATVRKQMQKRFCSAGALVVDEKSDLPVNEQYTSQFSGKRISNIGAKNSDYEASKFNTNSQPFYVIMDSNGSVLVPPQGANYNVDNYTKFLESGIQAYQNSH